MVPLLSLGTAAHNVGLLPKHLDLGEAQRIRAAELDANIVWKSEEAGMAGNLEITASRGARPRICSRRKATAPWASPRAEPRVIKRCPRDPNAIRKDAIIITQEQP